MIKFFKSGLITKANSLCGFWLFVMLASFLLALCVYLTQQNPVNPDGILYIETAKAYLSHGFRAAMAVYPWPFYAILIAWLHDYFSLRFLTSAFWLNNFFITLSILFFLGILKNIGAPKKILCTGALIILAWPTLNHFRSFIIRDAGYWAFLLAGIWAITRDAPHIHTRTVVYWGTSMLLASLFRIEGIIIWAFAPFGVFFIQNTQDKQGSLKKYLKSYIKLNCFFIAGMILLLAWRLCNPSHSLTHLGRLEDFFSFIQQAKSAATQNFLAAQAALDKYSVLGALKENTAGLLITGLFGVYVSMLVNTQTVIYCIFIIACFFYIFSQQKLNTKKQSCDIMATFNARKRWLIIFCLLNLLIPLLFFLQSFIIADRYVFAACFLLLLCAPFGLEKLWRSWQYHWENRSWFVTGIYGIVFLWFGIAALGGSGIVHFGYSKAYIVEAGEWLETHAPPQSRIYSNSREVLFYAGRSTLNWQNNDTPDELSALLEHNGWKDYNYIAIRINENNQNNAQRSLDRLPLQPIKTFINKRHDKVIIFYVSH